ncbi:MAG: tripartite tricarboxylate transporter substrate binding protein [Neofamilia sp.]
MKKRILTLASIFILSLSLVACSGDNQSKGTQGANNSGKDFPSGNIRVVVPFKAGGSADIMIRSLQPFWEEELGTNIVVENYDGAATLVGTSQFVNLDADGYNVLVTTQPYLSSTILVGNAKYTIDDFELINFQQLDPSCITVPADSPYKTFDDLIQAIKSNPGEMKVGTISGGASHVLLEILKEELNLDYRFISYSSGNEYRTALLGGHVDFIASSAQGDVSLGDGVRVLAIAGSERISSWPDAPTFDELGIEVPALGSGRILAVRSEVKENYPDRFEKLVETYEAAFNNPEYQKRLEDNGELDTSSFKGNEESNKMNKEVHETMLQYKDVILGK